MQVRFALEKVIIPEEWSELWQEHRLGLYHLPAQLDHRVLQLEVKDYFSTLLRVTKYVDLYAQRQIVRQ